MAGLCARRGAVTARVNNLLAYINFSSKAGRSDHGNCEQPYKLQKMLMTIKESTDDFEFQKEETRKKEARASFLSSSVTSTHSCSGS